MLRGKTDKERENNLIKNKFKAIINRIDYFFTSAFLPSNVVTIPANHCYVAPLIFPLFSVTVSSVPLYCVLFNLRLQSWCRFVNLIYDNLVLYNIPLA